MRKIECTPLYQISANLNGNAFYIKREDLIPFSFGGNKARKAIYIFEDFERAGADCIVTYGSDSSNHCRIIANLAASKSLPCHIISPMETQKATFNKKMNALFGAEITYCPTADVRVTIDNKISELKKQGFTPYFRLCKVKMKE